MLVCEVPIKGHFGGEKSLNMKGEKIPAHILISICLKIDLNKFNMGRVSIYSIRYAIVTTMSQSSALKNNFEC